MNTEHAPFIHKSHGEDFTAPPPSPCLKCIKFIRAFQVPSIVSDLAGVQIVPRPVITSVADPDPYNRAGLGLFSRIQIHRRISSLFLSLIYLSFLYFQPFNPTTGTVPLIRAIFFGLEMGHEI